MSSALTQVRLSIELQVEETPSPSASPAMAIESPGASEPHTFECDLGLPLFRETFCSLHPLCSDLWWWW
jgi:hypothetical protein